MKYFKLFLALGIFLIFCSTSWADIPNLINFQGILDSAGNPLANKTKSVEFKIHDDSVAGNVWWSETQTVTTNARGVFNVILGSSNPIPDSAFNDTVRYLGIKVGTDAEMTPRQRVASVGYANRVGSVDGASGGSIAGSIFLGEVDSSGPVQDAINAAAPLPCPDKMNEARFGSIYYSKPGRDFGNLIVTDGYRSMFRVWGCTGDVDITGRENYVLRVTINSLGSMGNAGIKLALDDFPKWSVATVSGGDFQVYNEPLGTNALYIKGSNNNVGIGGTTSPSEKLHVVGNICATGTIGACSDLRYKTNLKTVSNALEKVLKLKGTYFNWKKDQYPDLNFEDDRQIGFVAQELKEVLPEVVSQGTDGFYSVDYGKVTPLLVEAIKEQQKTIQSLEDKLEKLEKKFSRFTSQTSGSEEIGYREEK